MKNDWSCRASIPVPPPRQGGALPSELQPHHIILLILFAISLFRKSFSSSCSPIFKGSLQYIVVYIPTCNYYCELCIQKWPWLRECFFFSSMEYMCVVPLYLCLLKSSCQYQFSHFVTTQLSTAFSYAQVELMQSYTF